MQREHQTRYGHEFDHLAGLPVYSADNRRLGTVEGVVNPAGQSRERYMIVNADAQQADRKPTTGVEQLFVPESEIQSIDHDRVILETPQGKLPAKDWSTPPGGRRRT